LIYAHAPTYALEHVLAIRVHLDDSDAGNGPLRVLPETHRLGVLSDDAIHDLSSRIPPVSCHVPAGGVLLMSPLIVHSSPKVKPGNPSRRVLHIEYPSRISFPCGIEIRSC